MIAEKSTMTTEVVYSDNKEHRYLIKRSWDSKLPSVCVLMLSPSTVADTVALDMTSMYTINNSHRQGFGTLYIMNIFSDLNKENVTDADNDEQIAAVCKEASSIVLAWGKGKQTTAVATRLEEIFKLLKPFNKKLLEISDGEDSGFHPLGRTVRLQWQLVPAKPKNNP